MATNKESVLSLSDCKQIITNYLNSGDFIILNYDVQPFSNTVSGFMGDHLLIIIKLSSTVTANKEVRFFAKRFPFNHELQSRYALSVGAFSNEIFTYQVLFNEFKKFPGFDGAFAPRYYFGKDNYLLVFEDLSEKGFILPDHPNDLPMDHIKLSLKVLAEYHAGSIGYQEMKSKELGRKYRLVDEYPDCMQEPLFRKDENFLGYGWFRARLSALNAVIDLLPPFEDLTKEEFKQRLAKVADASFEILSPKDMFCNVLCHGDMWAKNVMFRYENRVPVDCKLVDFQLQRYCPPAHDVLQFIYLTTSTERRKRHLHQLLRFYHICLTKELERGDLDIDKILSYEDFEVSVNYLLPQIKLQTAYYYSFQGANPKFHKRVTTNLEEFKKFVFGDGAPFTTDLFLTDSNYRRLMTETLTELKDFVTHSRITLEDCFKIVEAKLKTTEYDLVGHSLVPLEKNSGFLGNHCRLKINIKVEGKEQILNLFAKCVAESKTRHNLAVVCKAFVKEEFFLQKLIPLIEETEIDVIKECIVPCHLIREHAVIIFDDLEFLNFQAPNPRVPFDIEDLKVVVRKLAIYHSTNIILEERLSNKRGTIFRLDHFKDQMQETFFPTHEENFGSLSMKVGIETVPYQIDLFPEPQLGLSNEDFKRKAEKAFQATYELVKPSNKYRNVACHGDLWTSNIMMKYEQGKPINCLIIDYQILRYCPPAHDLMCVLYLTTNRKTRALYMHELIKIYYDQFAKTLNEHGCNAEQIYTYEKFVESCEYITPQAVCQTVIYYHFTMTDFDLMKEYTSNEETANKIFLKDRREFIKEMCERDPIYKDRIHESIQDLREMCLKYF